MFVHKPKQSFATSKQCSVPYEWGKPFDLSDNIKDEDDVYTTHQQMILKLWDVVSKGPTLTVQAIHPSLPIARNHYYPPPFDGLGATSPTGCNVTDWRPMRV